MGTSQRPDDDVSSSGKHPISRCPHTGERVPCVSCVPCVSGEGGRSRECCLSGKDSEWAIILVGLNNNSLF